MVASAPCPAATPAAAAALGRCLNAGQPCSTPDPSAAALPTGLLLHSQPACCRAKTPLANFVTGMVVMLTLLVLTPIFTHMSANVQVGQGFGCVLAGLGCVLAAPLPAPLGGRPHRCVCHLVCWPAEWLAAVGNIAGHLVPVRPCGIAHRSVTRWAPTLCNVGAACHCPAAARHG